eukprot:TRINITY_DN5114_c0_g1_i1.p1 TRINITY_DN5114_c0_g1~~TRINITY_DN5114_c0_g1_i1.p1  ORF type:complete len:619 (+),score=73.97 TRINITY_DN5114_c0_g1_i1:44-1858(+)
MPEATPGKKPRICAKCDKEGAKFVCSQCKQTYYCSQECQTSHWPTHYRQCVKLKAPASASGKSNEAGSSSGTAAASKTGPDSGGDEPRVVSPGPSAAAAVAMAAGGGAASTKSQSIVDSPERTASGRRKYACSTCQKIGAKFICTACRQRHYCNAECQNAHWQNGHKKECKEFQAKLKANAVAPGASGSSAGQEGVSPARPAVVSPRGSARTQAQESAQEASPQPPASSLQSSLLYDGPERADHDNGYPLQPQSPVRPANGYVDEEPDTPVTAPGAEGNGARGEWDPATPVWGAGASPQHQLYHQQHHRQAASGLRQPGTHRTPGTAHKAIRRPNRGVKVYAPPRTRDAIEKLEQVREEYFRNRATETDILHPLSGADLQEHNKLSAQQDSAARRSSIQPQVEGRDRVGSTPTRAQRMPLRALGRQESAPVFPADRRRSSNTLGTHTGMSSGAHGPFGLIDIFNHAVSPHEKKASMDLVEERLRILVERLDTQCNVVQSRGLRSASETAEARQFVARMSACVAEMQSELLAVAASLARRHPEDADLLAPFLSRDVGAGNGSTHTSPAGERKRGKGKGKGGKGKGKGKGKRQSPKLLPGARAAWT